MGRFLTATVTVNLNRLKRFQAVLESDLRLSSNGPIRRAFQSWKLRFKAFIRKRFEYFSRGGGNWRRLAESTTEYKHKNKLLPWILRATDTLYDALDPQIANKPGFVSQDIEFGIRVGFGGGMRYPHTTSNVSIAEVAGFHQRGGGHLPQRKIIVAPDKHTIDLMREDMLKALREVAKDASDAA